MGLRKIGFFVLCAMLGLLSCKNDDDGGNGIITVPIRDRGEQQIVDNDSLMGYLKTHYYNSGTFKDNKTAGINELVITALKEGETAPPEGHSMLIDSIKTREIEFVGTDYQYYILKLSKGSGSNSPEFTDNIRVLYEGFLLNGNVFDSRLTVPSDFDLLTLISTAAVSGWARVFPEFYTAESFVENQDGTVSYINPGMGVMFLPSGLSYFNNSPSGIPVYSPLIFKFELLQSFENDHDNDGVPSYEEDINGDGVFTFNSSATAQDGDDTDNDARRNYNDNDDDGDGILTINEDLEDTDLNVDSDGDGDKTNDKNGDGDPTNDDTDGDGIPNYLDPDDAISKL